MKTKTNIGKSYYCLILVSIVLLIGCTPDVIYIDRNNTIIIYNTTYINRTINNTIPCNLTCLGPENITYDRSYTLELIRRLKYLEGQQDRYWNDSECNWELNKSNNELEECEDELCEFNSSWCN